MTIGQITKMAYIGTFPARRDVLKYESECAASLMNMDHNFFFNQVPQKNVPWDIFLRDLIRVWLVFQNLDPNVAYLEHEYGPHSFFWDIKFRLDGRDYRNSEISRGRNHVIFLPLWH